MDDVFPLSEARSQFEHTKHHLETLVSDPVFINYFRSRSEFQEALSAFFNISDDDLQRLYYLGYPLNGQIFFNHIVLVRIVQLLPELLLSVLREGVSRLITLYQYQDDEITGPVPIDYSHLRQISETIFFIWRKLGEIEVGDIPASEKTAADEEVESVAAIAIINLLKLDLENLALLEFAYKEAIAGENAVLNFLFKAFEKTEYLDTAIHVFQKLNEGSEMTHGKFLIARVVAINLPQILTFAEQLPSSIGEYLKANQESITNMFDFSEEAVLEDFEVRFVGSKKIWSEFCDKN